MFGLKQAYTLAFLLATAGALMVIFADGKVESPVLLGFFLFLAKLGVSIGMLANYLVIMQLFPTLFTGTVAGVCNFIARMGAIFAPLVAEVVPPYPMIIFI
jgi:sugar phosphate permease